MLWLFFFKQKTAYEMRISDWSSDVCSSDLLEVRWPAHRLGTGGAQHPFADRRDQAAVLGERNEAAGRDIAERRVGPADQRLEAAQGAVLCGDDGLVIEFEFAAVERAAQFLLHHASFFGLGVEIGRAHV